MTKVLKVPAKIKEFPDDFKKKKGSKYVVGERGCAFVFSGDLKHFRSKVKGKDLF